MIVAAAVCPQAPGLLPEVGIGMAVELADVSAACQEALTAVLAAQPDRIVVVGDGADGWDESAGGSLRGFGPDVRVGGPDVVLPPGLAVGAWLLDEAGWTGPRTYGSALDDVASEERVALVVMADGSARHRTLAPEWVDVEGREFDATVAKALADGDADALASLNLARAAAFLAAGIDGLVTLGETCKGAPVAANLRYDGAPFDVGYWVADWILG